MLETIEKYLCEELGDSRKLEPMDIRPRMLGIDARQFDRRLVTTLVFDEDDFEYQEDFKPPCRLNIMQFTTYEDNMDMVANMAPVVLACMKMPTSNREMIHGLTGTANARLAAYLDGSVILLPMYLRTNGYAAVHGIRSVNRNHDSAATGTLVMRSLCVVDVFVGGKRFSPQSNNNLSNWYMYHNVLRYGGIADKALEATNLAFIRKDFEEMDANRKQEVESNA